MAAAGHQFPERVDFRWATHRDGNIELLESGLWRLSQHVSIRLTPRRSIRPARAQHFCNLIREHGVACSHFRFSVRRRYYARKRYTAVGRPYPVDAATAEAEFAVQLVRRSVCVAPPPASRCALIGSTCRRRRRVVWRHAGADYMKDADGPRFIGAKRSRRPQRNTR